MTDDPTDNLGSVRRPEKDRRITNIAQFRYDKRLEAEAMIRLWERSRARDRAEQLHYWRNVQSLAWQFRLRAGLPA